MQKNEKPSAYTASTGISTTFSSNAAQVSHPPVNAKSVQTEVDSESESDEEETQAKKVVDKKSKKSLA